MRPGRGAGSALAGPRCFPPLPHPRLELRSYRLAQPPVETSHLADRIRLHGAEVDVVEEVVAAVVAELEHPLDARRPLLHVQPADVVDGPARSVNVPPMSA